jgi:hypothetical protein
MNHCMTGIQRLLEEGSLQMRNLHHDENWQLILQFIHKRVIIGFQWKVHWCVLGHLMFWQNIAISKSDRLGLALLKSSFSNKLFPCLQQASRLGVSVWIPCKVKCMPFIHLATTHNIYIVCSTCLSVWFIFHVVSQWLNWLMCTMWQNVK